MNVRIASRLHPDGKLYGLARLDELDPGELLELSVAHRRAVGLMAHAWVSPIAKLRLSRRLDAVVRVLVPTLEPAVLRRLSREQQVQIIDRWTGVNV